jgi:cytochrome b6-f complex iron-sulfur subunit
MLNKKKQNEQLPEKPHRRSFLKTLWAFLGIIATGEFLYVFFAFLKPGKKKSDEVNKNDLIEAGSVDDFSPDSVTAFVRGRFYLSRLKDGGFFAISRKCTHLGCTVPWVEENKKFTCPCHASSYDITGNVISSPAPRPLDIHPITIENSILTVNTGKTIRRKIMDKSQITYE